MNVKPEQMGVSSLPVGGGQRRSVNCLGGENLVINTSSEMQDEAWEFVRFATDEGGQKLRLPHTTPTLKTLYRDRQVLEEMPVISVCKVPLQNARPRPNSPHYSEMSRMMAEQFNSVLMCAISPEEGIKTLQSGVQQIIERGE